MNQFGYYLSIGNNKIIAELEFKKMKYDIVGISETKKKNKDCGSLKTGDVSRMPFKE